jgi:MFS family permease
MLLVLATVGGIINAIDLPARLAFVMEMVGREDVANAVALNSLLFNVARAAGPILGGFLLKWLHPGLCFLVNALSFVAVLLALTAMRVRPAPPTLPVAQEKPALGSAWDLLRGRPRLLFLLVLVGIMAFFGWPSQALLPAVAKLQLHTDELGYSLLLTGTGVGALVAALSVATFATAERTRKVLGTGMALTSLGLIGLSFVRNLELAVACNALVGGGLILFFATSQAVFQLSASDKNRGRIMAIWSMVLSGANPIGNFIAGPAADRWHESRALLVMGLGCGASLASVLVYLAWRTLTANSCKRWPEIDTATSNSW